MKIENGKIVKLAVVNHLENGQIWGTFEQTGRYPEDFSYAPLRERLLGMSPEEHANVATDYLTELPYSPDLVFELPIENFKGVDELKVGMIFKTTSQMKIFSGRVTHINEHTVTLDCNHPFRGEAHGYVGFLVIDVRDPTEEEKLGQFSTVISTL